MASREGPAPYPTGNVTHLHEERRIRRAADQGLELADAVLSSFASHVALLDDRGDITFVNRSWARFGRENDGRDATCLGIGGNYLQVCAAAADACEDAAEALEGIRSVLEGGTKRFEMRYACHSSTTKRWFAMVVTPPEGRRGAIVCHTDITSEKVAEVEALEAAEEIARLQRRLHSENVYLREEIETQHGFDGIVGSSPSWLTVLDHIQLVADTSATVLFAGETGTGKELLARALHDRGARSERPLVTVNCAALPETLIESELFGHTRGAFSGATVRRKGRFELADEGTIFLDEVGELPLDLQAKLLRVLQSGEFEPLGSSTTRRADVRVIAATNRDLESEVEAGRFRSDLYYRLAVFPIEVPALRQRKDDVPLLLAHFLARSCAAMNKEIDRVSVESLETLMSYDWPGNVRELENLVERAVILSPSRTLRVSAVECPVKDGRVKIVPVAPLGDERPDDEIDTISLVAPGPGTGAVREEDLPSPPVAQIADTIEPPPPSVATTLEDVERRHILRVLESCDGKVKGRGNAAESLGLNPSTLRSRMKKLGIARQAG